MEEKVICYCLVGSVILILSSTLGPLTFSTLAQPDLTLILDGNSSTCLSAASLGPNLSVLKLKMPWGNLENPSTKIVGNETMMCNANPQTLSSENVAYVIFLYMVLDQEATYRISELGIEGKGQMCDLDSENVVSGLKECVFTCACDFGKCPNAFLNVLEQQMDICEIIEV